MAEGNGSAPGAAALTATNQLSHHEMILHALLILAKYQSNKEGSGYGVCRRVKASTEEDRIEYVYNLDNTDTDPKKKDADFIAAVIPYVGSRDTEGANPACEYCKGAKCADERRKTGAVVVSLHNLDSSFYSKDISTYSEGKIHLKSGSVVSKQSFLPLAVDDYFMAVAILTKRLWSGKSLPQEQASVAGACIVSSDSLRVICIGYSKNSRCAELDVLLNAQKVSLDLTKYHLYTTGSPCLNCTKVILQAGIRVVVHGSELIDQVKEKVFKEKACFKKYECHIRIEEDEMEFLIDLSQCKVIAKELCPPKPQSQPPQPSVPSEQNPDDQPSLPSGDTLKRPSYRDFFMAMAFLSHTRAKDMKYQVGACLVTPAPHRLVAMGYNGMPDGRGFKDDKMDWGSEQSKYKLNAIIAAFRREADLSACTLYVTYSPCQDCAKLVAQSGIKNLVFAKYYDNGKPTYESLGRLPDMNIMRYEYMDSGYTGVEKIIIDLTSLTADLQKSMVTPQTEWKTEKRERTKSLPTQQELHQIPIKLEKGRRDVDFPLDDYFMSLAVLATCRSPLPQEKKAGACIVYQEPRRVVSVGYSGYIDGMSDGKKKENVCCAEFNVIVSAFRYHADLTSATLYTTGVPCARCATTIVQSGIKTIVYGWKQQQGSGQASQQDEMEKEAKEIFYWAKVATLEYKVQTKKSIIEIDLRGLIVDQRTK